MPLSTFMGLETTLRGILAQQLAINVTGHNIANANTVGYTRQTAVLAPTDAYTEPGVSRPPQAGQLGTGVDVTAYTRVRDGFLDIQYRAQAMKQGSATATQDGLSQVQDALAEPSDHGLNSLLQQYWSSWQDVSNAPENMATRQSLAQNAASLADGFNALASQLSTIQSQTGQNVLSTIDQVNSIGGRIAQLNDAIMKDTVTGDHPNDLLDQRDLLIDQLSQLGNVSVTATTYGQVDVSIGGASLVSGATAATLAESNMTSLTSGKLSGLITLRDTTIPGYQSQLDTVASTLITATNAQHALGFDLNGNAGGAFFTGTSASTIAINPALISNPALIAASGNGNVGNADNALSLANIRNQALVGASTIDTAYSQLVTQIGSDTQQAQRDSDTANLLTGSIDDRRQSVSGVSLDEEMTNLVKFQRGYQASARAMSAMDEMIDQLISRTGKVGL
ncbi:MAG TPA: flagellar hook-associated protein FlgK [Gaiellales bacterium]|nr:flagellar hook-associated protein FlgK [Gaiellales bacterium]